MIADELRALADSNTDEVCGAILITSDGKPIALQMENVSETPGTAFRFHDEDTIRLYELCDMPGWQLQAIWHSHPRGDAAPSRTDLEYAQPGLLMVIVGRDGVRVYDHTGQPLPDQSLPAL